MEIIEDREKIRITLNKQERMDLINSIGCIDLSMFNNTVLKDFKENLTSSIINNMKRRNNKNE